MDPILKSLADNQALFDAVKAALVKKFDTGDLYHQDITNEMLGQQVRARLEGLACVEELFREIARMKTGQPAQNRVNPSL